MRNNGGEERAGQERTGEGGRNKERERVRASYRERYSQRKRERS